MNPATGTLIQRIDDRQLRRFVHDWDDFEALVIRVYRAGEPTNSDARELVYLRRRLRRAYVSWQAPLRPHWPEALELDPFRKLLEIEAADALVDNWEAMQTLPHARQAINQFLLARLEGVQAELDHLELDGRGVRLHAVQAGPESGFPVILLHGFPEFWYGWRHQIDALSEAGYRVLALDQRGYNRSDKPQGIAAYRPALLVADLVAVMDGMGLRKAAVVGHDWGASVAWWAAYAHPDRLERMVIMNVPHPRVFADALRTSWRQLLRSWYIAAIQLPRLPELLLRLFGYALLKAALRRSSGRNTFTRQDLRAYQQAWAQPGALTGMLNWYRAVARYQPRISTRGLVQVPTLMIWGARDIALGREMAPASIERCKRGKLVMVEQASHWVQHEAAGQVNKLMLDFLSGG